MVRTQRAAFLAALALAFVPISASVTSPCPHTPLGARARGRADPALFLQRPALDSLQAGRKEKRVCVSSGERWDGCGVGGAVGVGVGLQEMPTVGNTHLLVARTGGMIFLLQDRKGGVRVATIKGKRPCKGAVEGGRAQRIRYCRL
ncbi:hypothetical protein T484DRAFT_1891193 [Baffinella frigidus]|nr:hypothetical protein T484DRAFT_1891193 [Cryptophyta sp. CCMP2293]